MASDDEDQTAQFLEEPDDDIDLLEDDDNAVDLIEEEDNAVDLNEEEEEDDDDMDLIEEEEEDDDSMSSAAAVVTVAVAGDPRTAVATPPPTSAVLETSGDKRPAPLPAEDSRRLFQRLWTDEDEIELLKGFLEYTTLRGINNMTNHHHHDTAAFYDEIKGKLQLEFNKNQLVEKLRRLKKKFRNVISKIKSGKDYMFKSPHDQATFDISCKIWSEVGATPVAGAGEGNGVDDDEGHNVGVAFNLNDNGGIGDVKRSKKHARLSGVKIEESYGQGVGVGVGVGAGVSNNVTTNVVEETVKSCLLPLFKELVNKTSNGAYGGSRGLGGMNLDPFGGVMNFSIGDMSDEKWRKQHILELEVYSKRLELMQDQVKLRLDEVKSTGNS